VLHPDEMLCSVATRGCSFMTHRATIERQSGEDHMDEPTRGGDGSEQDTKARIAELSRRVVQAAEDERRRLAAELHDGIGPSLAALQIDLGRAATTLQRGAPDSSDAAQRMLREAMAQLRDIVAGVRALGTQWRPAALERFGLVAAIEAGVQRFEWQGLSVACDTSRMPEGRLPAAVEATLYRCAMECLANCARHSDAARAEVELSMADGVVTLDVQDDGVGFDASHAPLVDASGLGLLSMREAAELLGGSLRIDSAAGRGTRISMSLPVPADAVEPTAD